MQQNVAAGSSQIHNTFPDLRCKEHDLLQTEAFGAVTQFEAAKSRIGTGSRRVSASNTGKER